MVHGQKVFLISWNSFNNYPVVFDFPSNFCYNTRYPGICPLKYQDFFIMRITIFLVLITVLLILNSTPLQKEDSFNQAFVTTNTTQTIQSEKLDKRAMILSDYLALHNSPLQYHAQDFIDAADTYKMDWKLVPAISGVESTFGKFIPGGYNAWGWAIYNSDSRFGFKSWRDGIFTVTQGLKKNYIDKGLTNPYAMNTIYAASPHWGWKVAYFMEDINKFTNNHPSNKMESRVQPGSLLGKTAASSARVILE